MRSSRWIRSLVGVGGSLALVAMPLASWAAEGEHPAVQELERRGVLQGYPKGKFEPNKPVTRLELAVILARLLRAIESNPAAAQQPEPPKRQAAAKPLPAGVPQWARTEVAFLADRGYPTMLPSLCRDWQRPARQKDVTDALKWALASVSKRGYIPPGDLAPPPADPNVQ